MNDFLPLPVACATTRSSTRALQCAFTWAVVFTAMHGYWYLGGRFGVGDGPNPLPGAPSSPAAWIFTILVLVMFALGLAVPIALLKSTQRKLFRRLLVALLWAGSLVLLARGASGLLDDGVRSLGLSSGGITGLSYQDLFGTAHPSTYTLISSASIDGYFLLGGILYGCAAWFCRTGHVEHGHAEQACQNDFIHMAQNKTIDYLNRLIAVNRNAEAGFVSAAESVKNSELETLFGNYAKQHAKFAADLQDEVRRLDGDITESGTLGGTVQRGWMDVKAALSGGAAAASILKSCESAEQSAEVAYLDAIDANPSGQTHTLIAKQQAQIEGFRTHLTRLVGETKDGIEFQKNE